MIYQDLLNGWHEIYSNAICGENVRIGRFTVIEAGCRIGSNVIIGHNVVLRPGTIVGDNSIISHGCVCEGDTTIGRRVMIEPQCHLTKGMIIEDDVFLGPGVITCNTRNISHGRGFEPLIEGPRIRRAARIGSGAMICPGIEIGHNAVVGVGSVVTKDVPAMQVWYGGAACFKRWVPGEELL